MVDLAVQEAQPARLLLVDDRHLDAVDHRQLAALELGQQRLAFGVVGGGLGVVEHVAVARVALQHDQRAAPPLRQPERPGAHRVRDDLVAVVFDDLARHRAEQVTTGEQRQQRRARLAQPHLEGVALRRLQPRHVGVVVEGLAALQRLLALRLQPFDVEFLQVAPHRALVRRVGETLERIDVVGGDEFALPALERRVVGEVDAGFDAHRPDAVVGRHLWETVRGVRLDLRRPRQMVVVVQAFEDVRRDGARVQVRDARRVEAGLGGRERGAQHLLRGRRLGLHGCAGEQNRQRPPARGARHHPPRAWRAASMSTMCHHSCQNNGRTKPCTHGCSMSA